MYTCIFLKFNSKKINYWFVLSRYMCLVYGTEQKRREIITILRERFLSVTRNISYQCKCNILKVNTTMLLFIRCNIDHAFL